MYSYYRAVDYLRASLYVAIAGLVIGVAFALALCGLDDNPTLIVDHVAIFIGIVGVTCALLFSIVPLLLAGYHGIVYLCRERN